MRCDLDDLARLIRAYGLCLAYSASGYAKLAFRYPALPRHIRQALRNRRAGLARLMLQGDIRLCPVAAHKREWFYAGRGRYVCPLCRRIDAQQMGMWKAS